MEAAADDARLTRGKGSMRRTIVIATVALLGACGMPRLVRTPGSNIVTREPGTPKVRTAPGPCAGPGATGRVSGAHVGADGVTLAGCGLATTDTAPSTTLDGRVPRPVP